MSLTLEESRAPHAEPEAGSPARPAPAAPPDAPPAGAMRFDEDHLGRNVNALAWPIIAENLFQTALGIVDMAMVSGLGAVAIAGVGAAIQVIFLLASAMSAVAIGTTALVARATGTGQTAEANRVTKQSIVAGLVATALLMIVGLALSRPILAVMGLEAAVIDAGAEYLTILMVTGVVFVLPFIFGAALRGAGDSRTPMIATGVMNLLNVCFAWVLIFGNLGFPALGVAGSAWAAALGRGFGCLILLAVLLRGRARVSIRGRSEMSDGRLVSGWWPDFALIGRMLRIGVPAALEQVAISAGFLIYGLIVVQMGTIVYAVQRITWNAIGLSFMPGFSFAMAATALTGQALGAGRPDLAKRMTWYAVNASTLWMSLMGVVFFLFGEQLMLPFTSDPEMIRLGAESLRVIALAQPFMSLGMVLAGGLRGAGDTRFPLIVSLLTMWGVRLPLGWVFGLALGWGLPGVYLSGVVDAVARGLFTWLRYRVGDWQRSKV